MKFALTEGMNGSVNVRAEDSPRTEKLSLAHWEASTPSARVRWPAVLILRLLQSLGSLICLRAGRFGSDRVGSRSRSMYRT